MLGKRKDSGLYGLPGGWLEKYEDWDECASRELKEEVNLDFKRNRFREVDTFNSIHVKEHYHAISLIMYSEIEQHELKDVKNMEPNKCEKWQWVTFPQLRSILHKLFYPLKDFLTKHPKLNSFDYLKELVAKKPVPVEQKSVKKKKKGSISSMTTNSPFYSSTLEDESILSADELCMI